MKSIKFLSLFLVLIICMSCDKEDIAGKVKGPNNKWYEAQTTFTDEEINQLLMSKAWQRSLRQIYNSDWTVPEVNAGISPDGYWFIHIMFFDGKYFVEGAPEIDVARNYVNKTLETLGEDYLDKYTIKDGVIYLESNGYVQKKTVLAINQDYIFFDSDFEKSGIRKEYWGKLPN